MGLDFITQKAKSFKKLWDGGRDALAEPDLFSPEEHWEEQRFLFDVHDGCTLTSGDELLVQPDTTGLVALRRHDIVATAVNPTDSVLTAVRRAKGYVIARVTRFSPLSRTADLTIRVP